MTPFSRRCFFLLTAALLIASAGLAEDNTIQLGEGTITLTAPDEWESRSPRVKIIEYEFAIPKADGDAADGRVTVMGAGGSIEANIQRWTAQFTKLDSREGSAVTKSKIAGQEVHIIDLSGSYKDRRGPFAPATIRENYRMLAAIIVTEKRGQYFVKAYGPKDTIDAADLAFRQMLETLDVK